MKKLRFLIIIIFFIFCFPNIVHAAENEVKCSDIRNKYNEYLATVTEYNSLVCDSPNDMITYNKCVSLVVKKNSYIQDLFNLNDKNNTCNISEVNTLLSENSSNCTNSFSSDVQEFSSSVMNSFYIIAPFLLIIFGSIDFFKIIVNGDPKTIQKNRSNFFKRLAAFLLLYFTPFIVKEILSLSVYTTDGTTYICTYEISQPQTLTQNTIDNSNTRLYSGYYGYDNSSVGYNSVIGGNIIQSADSISKSWASQKYSYFDDSHPLVYNNIEQSINNSSKGTCCATLVAATLYKAGIVSETEINSVPYNGAYYLAELLDRKKWQIIDSYDYIKSGDIVFMTSSANAPVTLSNGKTYNQGHVQIYAGGTNWYNAGSTSAIQGSQPSVQEEDYVRGRFSFAMRAPSN